jgi:hypothetical protein
MFVIGGMIGVMAVGGMLTWARMAPAQQPQVPPPFGTTPGQSQVRQVTQDVVVRAGPSEEYYVTNQLRKGDTVEVVHQTAGQNSGWLAIKPPPQSRSWIKQSFVRTTAGSATGIVEAPDGAPVHPVGLDVTKEKELEFVKLKSGDQPILLPISPKKEGLNTWVAIEPPAAELRYISASALAPNTITRVNAEESTFTPASGVSYVSQGDQYLNQARDAYTKAAGSSDPNQSNVGQYKLRSLNAAIAQMASFTPPGYPSTSSAFQTNNTTPPRVNLNTPAQLTGANTALYNTANTAAQTGPGQWSKWGSLKKTSFTMKDGQPMYRLEDDRGTPLGYAVAGPGLTLEPYVGQVVCLWGTSAYRSDDNAMRVNYTVVSQISLAKR